MAPSRVTRSHCFANAAASRGFILLPYSLAVETTIRRRKLGTNLLRAVEAAAVRSQRKAIRLEVKPGNRRALRLYRSFGYRIFAELDGHYSDGSKALRLQKAFGGSNGWA